MRIIETYELLGVFKTSVLRSSTMSLELRYNDPKRVKGIVHKSGYTPMVLVGTKRGFLETFGLNPNEAIITTDEEAA